MSFHFGDKSLKKLYKCHPLLVELMLNAIRTSEDDITVICGTRSNEAQQEAYENGKSLLKPGKSKHNKIPSEAVDIAPYPIKWDNIRAFEKLGKHVKECADSLNITIKWGGDWSMLKDYVHFELKL